MKNPYWSFLFCLFGIAVTYGQALNTEKLQGMKARAIGPAGMSGRITTIDVVNSKPDIIYLGSASGGLWKSTNGGISFAPIFDDQPVSAIGSVAVCQQNPDLIWVGTGEGNPRNSQNSGNGVYKSLDGGKTWQHMGLENTRNIHRVIIHPRNPDIVYVGVQGSAWGDHEERGFYKTTDGGKTWRKTLYTNKSSGIADLVTDPRNPEKLIAALWEFRRTPWFFKSGGAGSGLYVSLDGGETWKKRTPEDGLPEGELGRMGLAIARSNPSIVYALVESKKNGLYKSEDGGATFTKVSDQNVGSRPFYYFDLYVDPKNENRLYNINMLVSVSEDGGRTYKPILTENNIHTDHHAFWIHPDNTDFLIDGNDGGAAISRDRGKSWQFVENLPLAQFYHINVDMETPYNVYGGMQDNGSWRGPSAVWREGNIRNNAWEELFFGDGFDVVPDKSDPNYAYAMAQGGALARCNIATGAAKYIKPVHPDGSSLRFNWNAGIAADPFDPKTIYYGSQFVHKSTNRGDAWEIISPDLTTNDTTKQKQLQSGGLTYDITGAENYTTIITIVPSPVKQGILWVGTDDGNLQLTTDGGKTWTNLSPRLKGVPANTWIPHIHASAHNANEAFVVLDNHRRNDWTPYIYRTRDLGKTWERLNLDPKMGFAYSMVQDPVEPNLLFAGTEFGLHVSIDGAKTWTKWKAGFPTVPTLDLAIHPRDADLVIGTFGRAAYVLDDIRPLRALAKEGSKVLDQPLRIFEAPVAYQATVRQPAGMHDFRADNYFYGENKPSGATISFVFNNAAKAEKDKLKTDSVKVEVLNASREVIRTFKAPAKPGINRLVWKRDQKMPRLPGQPKPTPDKPETGGMEIMPGEYLMRLSFDKAKDSAKVMVKPDPRLPLPTEVLTARNEIVKQLVKKIETATTATDRLRESQEKIDLVNKQLGSREDEKAKNLKKTGEELKKKLKALLYAINPDPEIQGLYINPNLLSSQLMEAMNYLQQTEGMPTTTEQNVMKKVDTALQKAVAPINDFFAKDWEAYKKAVSESDIKLFEAYEPLKTTP